jgi:hypothetical protein
MKEKKIERNVRENINNNIKICTYIDQIRENRRYRANCIGGMCYCDFLPGLNTRASYFTDRLVICRISVGSSPQSDGADIDAGIEIPIHL